MYAGPAWLSCVTVGKATELSVHSFLHLEAGLSDTYTSWGCYESRRDGLGKGPREGWHSLHAKCWLLLLVFTSDT